MSIEALLDRFVVAVETVAEEMVAERLHRERGGLGTPAHVTVAGLVDQVIARRIDGKEVQLEIDKFDRPKLIKSLEERGIVAKKGEPKKRLQKQLHDSLMNNRDQDAVYAGTRQPTAAENLKAEEEANATPTEPVEAEPKAPEVPEAEAKAPSGGAESDGPSDQRPAVEKIEFSVVLDACKKYIQAVHKNDPEKGQTALLGIMHKHEPNAKKLGDMMDSPKLREFYEEVLNI